tara:strand:+ start:219 stop:737 length:519 start_codon:yes stop_codon:yes gene_type:complete
MSVPTVSGLARQYIAGFEGDDFVPKTLNQAGLLSDAGKALMASIPATNFAAEVQAMKSGFDIEKQAGYNETLLQIQELKNEQAKKKAIIDQLSTPMAGTSLTKFLSGGVGNTMADSLENSTMGSVLGSDFSYYPSQSNKSESVKSVDLESIKKLVSALPEADQSRLLKGISN